LARISAARAELVSVTACDAVTFGMSAVSSSTCLVSASLPARISDAKYSNTACRGRASRIACSVGTDARSSISTTPAAQPSVAACSARA
jgi:hypothetical protein